MTRKEPFRIGRRSVLAALGAGAWAARGIASAAEQPLQFTGFDHVEFWASDVEKSAAFYARIFGNTVLKNNKTARRYVKLGTGVVAMDKGPEPRVDHICAGIAGFQVAALHSYLEQRSVPYKDYPSGRDLYVSDPDGTRLQIGAENSWSQLLMGTASAEPTSSAGEPVFQPAGIDHILLNVSEPEKSAAFYEKLFGPVAQRNNNRIWFQVGKSRLGLLQTPAGQRPGVNHFCIAAPSFDYAAVTRKLEQAGARVEAPEVAGAPEFRDRDGLLVQVMTPRATPR